MKFKKLELEPENKGIKAILKSAQLKRTLLSILIGALVGVGIYYFNEGRQLEAMATRDILQSAIMGGFFGFFITNSPCARNRC